MNTNGLNAISCPSAMVCYAGGGDAGGGSATILVTRNGGDSWTPQTIPAGVFMSSIGCGSPTSCIAVGSPSSTQTSSSSTVISTTDGGATWALSGFSSSSATSATLQGLDGVRCVDVHHCWTVGPGALFTADLGASWQTQQLPMGGCPPSGVGCVGVWSQTIDVEFQSATDGWVVGGEQCGGQGVTECPGAAFHTTDGGATWTFSPGSAKYPFGWQIACQGSSCLMVTQAFTHTVIADTNNNGASWSTLQQLPTEISALACSPSRSFCIAAGGYQNRPSLLTLGVIGAPSPGPSTPGGGGAGDGGVSAPGSVVSTLGSSLATPTALSGAPLTALVNALIVLALILLVTFPAHLFNRTYDENHEVIQGWVGRRLQWAARLRTQAVRGIRPSLRAALSVAAVLVVGGVLATVLDPHAGLSVRSLALFLGAALAITAGATVTGVAAGVYRTVRHRGHTWQLHALPSGLLVAAVCVAISRLTAFQPGYLYGLIGGVAFAGQLGRREQGHEVAVASVSMLSVSVLAWLLWVPVSSNAAAQPTSFGWALLENFLAALFVSGIVGLLIGLVPLRFLPGERLARWHWGAWGVVFGLTALAMLEVMLRPESSGAHVAGVPLWTTIGLFGGFGAASIAFWGYFRLRRV